tara:strand:- start:256 stop:660 length:405 start_codon:yes stop_codon:yes gene_type:complete
MPTSTETRNDLTESIIQNNKNDTSFNYQERFHKLTNELRCLVCQNQSVAESNSSLAIDLRNQVSEQILAGKNDKEILTFMEERYGEFVLYKPQLSYENSLLWIGPFIVLLIAIVIALNTIKKHADKKNKEIKKL